MRLLRRSMETVEQITERYGSKLSWDQIESAKEIENINEIRSIWYDIITNLLYVCFETSGDIFAIESDGTLKLKQRG